MVCRRVNQNGNLDLSHAALSTRQNDFPNCEVWKAGRATSAAPTYFLPQDIQNRCYVDGGLGFNNPIRTIPDEYSRLGFQEIDRKRIYYVSIGTGKPSADELDRSKQYWRQLSRHLLLRGIRSFRAVLPRRAPFGQLARFLTDSETWNALVYRGVDENAHITFKNQIEAEGPPDAKRYFRLNCDKDHHTLDDGRGLSDITLDGYVDLQNIGTITNNYLQRGPEEIQHCVEQLQREARAGTIQFVA